MDALRDACGFDDQGCSSQPSAEAARVPTYRCSGWSELLLALPEEAVQLYRLDDKTTYAEVGRDLGRLWGETIRNCRQADRLAPQARSERYMSLTFTPADRRRVGAAHPKPLLLAGAGRMAAQRRHGDVLLRHGVVRAETDALSTPGPNATPVGGLSTDRPNPTSDGDGLWFLHGDAITDVLSTRTPECGWHANSLRPRCPKCARPPCHRDQTSLTYAELTRRASSRNGADEVRNSLLLLRGRTSFRRSSSHMR